MREAMEAYAAGTLQLRGAEGRAEPAPQHDGYNSVRAEYSQMLRTQLAQGNNGLTKTKYLTFGIEADSIRQAKPAWPTS